MPHLPKHLNTQCTCALQLSYDDPKTKDKVKAVQAQVEDVKLTMHKNIDGMLKNLEKTNKIEHVPSLPACTRFGSCP